MNLLLDTHVLLWVLTDDPHLASEARAAISDGRNQVFVSAVSAWEITIKRALGKLVAPDDLPVQLSAARFKGLDVTIEHALAVGGLANHHHDPFDRLLVAQAQIAALTIVTHDPQVQRYNIAILPA